MLVSDGAMGTQLASLGMPAGVPSELWNLERPEAVKSVYESYVAAGSDIICTNTFGANRIKLAKFQMENRVGELTVAGVKLAREVARESLVAASVGPTGEIVEPYGDLSAGECEKALAESCAAAAAAGADAILLETFYDIEEAKIAIRAGLETGLTIICTMTFDAGGRTMMGVTPARAAEELPAAGAAIVGANCGVGPDALLPIVREICAVSDVPVMVQPNAGMPVLTEHGPVYSETPERMAAFALRYLELGARIVGGCCGSTPAHVAAIARAVKGFVRGT